jgi:hypothetical protein
LLVTFSCFEKTDLIFEKISEKEHLQLRPEARYLMNSMERVTNKT